MSAPTWADIKRRLVPGAVLVCEEHRYPDMVGSVRQIVGGTTVLRCLLQRSGGVPADRTDFRWELPKAKHVRVLDEDRFEYDLTGSAGGTVRLRFAPTPPPAERTTKAALRRRQAS
jgi:hypothetical protein